MKLNSRGEKRVPLTPETVELLKQQKQRFVEKFGREPGPNDPVFFDEQATTPQLRDEAAFDAEFDSVLDGAQAAGIDPAIIHACKKTRRMVTAQNMQYLTKEELNEWQAAIDEYNNTIKPGIQ